MNEAETRAELIDPALKAAGWGVVEGSKVHREYRITLGRIEGHGKRAKPEIADYVLVYRNRKLGVIEAKAWDEPLTGGLAQAKSQATKLSVRFAYCSNGQGIYRADMHEGAEGEIAAYPTPEQLWNLTFAKQNAWRDRFAAIPLEETGGSKSARYYQETAIERVLEAVAENKQRILLTLATGTGKTFIAFQIAWKLFHARWNLSREPTRRPRILFLADRNILADQAYNAFSAFPEDALIRISPEEIRKKGKPPTNGSIFFTIFQTFMTNSGTARLQPGVMMNDAPNPISADSSSYIVPPLGGSGLQPIAPSAEQNPTTTQRFERAPSPRGEGRGEGPPPARNVTILRDAQQFQFGAYPPDFFDFIIIDECHRGGAQDESNWRGILEYFYPAVQLGLTATPKRKDNVDTYAYFGEPVYIYSLKEGINDGFLTPFKVKQISTTLDEYIYTQDDRVVEGEPESGKRYVESDFNRIIEIKEREAYRVKTFLDLINQNEKTLVFCATQDHALAVRDLINQMKISKDPNYCARVTANDGSIGDQHLRDFQDNEKTIPTILTTSQKLSTGVDARNVRNIVLMRPINSMIEFKQIIGRGTRLYEGKSYFTIFDFVKAHYHFNDPEWDGEPLEPVPKEKPPIGDPPPGPGPGPIDPPPPPKKIKIKLANGKERTIQHMVATSYWSPNGTPMSAEEFLKSLYGTLPEFFKSEDELRSIWSAPSTRKAFLTGLSEKGFGHDQLAEMQKIINAEKSDLFDVLAYVAFESAPITREQRADFAKTKVHQTFSAKQQAFLDFVLNQYVKVGVEELDPEKLAPLLKLKYDAIQDAVSDLGQPQQISFLFADFQKYLYQPAAA
jgi:type I restriction enzyme R subunit